MTRPRRAAGRRSSFITMQPVVRLGLAAFSTAVVLAGCGIETGYGGPLDPSAAHIVPRTGNDAAVLETTAAADAMLPGVEGSVLFVRLVDAEGTTILDRAFAWPSDRQHIPPGAYGLTVYWRGCVGNCGNLDPESPFCTDEIAVAAMGRVVIDIVPRQLQPGSSCTVVAT